MPAWLGVSAIHSRVTNYPQTCCVFCSIYYLPVSVVRNLGAAQLDLLLVGPLSGYDPVWARLPSHLRAHWGRTHSQLLHGSRSFEDH